MSFVMTIMIIITPRLKLHPRKKKFFLYYFDCAGGECAIIINGWERREEAGEIIVGVCGGGRWSF